MKTLRVGIIGVGNIGTAHCGCIAGGRIKGMTLAALCDIDGEKREILAGKYHVPVFEDGDELINSGLVNAVIVATPHRFQAAQRSCGKVTGEVWNYVQPAH